MDKSKNKQSAAEWTLKNQIGKNDPGRKEYEEYVNKKRSKKNESAASGKTRLTTDDKRL